MVEYGLGSWWNTPWVVPGQARKMHISGVLARRVRLASDMTELTTRKRDQLERTDFAYVDHEGGEHLPIHDASHVRNAISRFNQTEFESKAAKERAQKKILVAARKFDIEIDEDDKVFRSR